MIQAILLFEFFVIFLLVVPSLELHTLSNILYNVVYYESDE